MSVNNIMFSGGFDSTALLLSKYGECKNFPQNYNVISVYHELITNKDEDKKARDRIKEILKDHPHNKYFNFVEINVSGGLGASGQASIWPQYALEGAVSTYERSECNIFFGYIKGDDFFHFKGEYMDLYKSYEKVIRGYENITDFKINPIFPFEWFTKRELVYMYSTIPEVFYAISWAGDTVTCKAKEKEEIENIFEQIKLGLRANERGEKKVACDDYRVDKEERKEVIDLDQYVYEI
jgi:hypothetical protein